MNTKQILIQILTKFNASGVKAATSSLGGLKNMASGLTNVFGGFGKIGGSILSAINPLNIFNSLFGRVTLGMLTWTAWRKIADGFRFLGDAIVGGNVKMQQALNTFTALARGSEEIGNQYVAIIRQMAGNTGIAVDELLENARRLPTQVGQNFKAFEKLSKTAIVLGMIDPVQGAEGAMIALTNAMEGTAAGFRSLIQRFEIGTLSQVNRILKETSDPLEAINKLLEESGIDVDRFIDAQMNTLGVAWNGIINTAREFLRIIGEPTVNKFTEDVIRLRDWLLENRAAIEGLARAIGQRLAVSLQGVKKLFKDVFLGGEDITPESMFEAFLTGIMKVADFITSVIVGILKFITNVISFIAQLLGAGPIEPVVKKTVNSVRDTISFAAKESKEAVAETVKDIATAIPEATQVAARSVGEVTSALVGMAKKGKETTERFVKTLTEGMDADAIKKVIGNVTDNIINLEAQEITQEKSIDSLEDWIKKAEKEVNAAKKKLQLFDEATADIPERYTRARRRQIEQEIRRAEEERDRRKEGLDAAKEQLAATKENLAAQRDILGLLEKQAEAAESSGGGINKGFVAPELDTSQFENQVQAFADKFAGQIEPVFQNLEDNFSKIGDFIRGLVGADPSGELSEMYEVGLKLRDALSQIGETIVNVSGKIAGFFEGAGGSAAKFWSSLPEGVKTLLLVLLGILVVPGGGAIAWTIAITSILNDPTNIMGWLTGGGVTLAALIAGGTILALPVAITILAAEIWGGWDELVNWVNLKRPLAIAFILTAQLDKFFSWLMSVISGNTVEVNFIGRIVGKGLAPIVDSESGIFEPGAIGEGLNSASNEIGSTLDSWYHMFTDWATDVDDELVGNSILPDMVGKIVNLFQSEAPSMLSGPLDNLSSMFIGTMSNIRSSWLSDLSMMSEALRSTMDLQSQMQSARLETSAVGASRSISNQLGRNAGSPQALKANLRLNAKETRRLMREGVYDGIEELF